MQPHFATHLTTAVLGVFLCVGGMTLLSAADGGTTGTQTQTQSPATSASASHTDQPHPSPDAAKDGSVWGALVYASNSSSATASTDADASKSKDPKDFPNLSKRLAKAFPFNHFEVIGQHNQVVFREYESWVVPSREVFLKLDSKGSTSDGGLNLHLQFWRGRQVLVKSDIKLHPDSPLFIGGPKWRDGQLIFVLELKETNKAK